MITVDVAALRALLSQLQDPLSAGCLAALNALATDHLYTSLPLAAGLARTLGVKYEMARAKGHLVIGLEGVLQFLTEDDSETARAGLIVVQGAGSDYFTLVLDPQLDEIRALMHVVPLADGGGEADASAQG